MTYHIPYGPARGSELGSLPLGFHQINSSADKENVASIFGAMLSFRSGSEFKGNRVKHIEVHGKNTTNNCWVLCGFGVVSPLTIVEKVNFREYFKKTPLDGLLFLIEYNANIISHSRFEGHDLRGCVYIELKSKESATIMPSFPYHSAPLETPSLLITKKDKLLKKKKGGIEKKRKKEKLSDAAIKACLLNDRGFFARTIDFITGISAADRSLAVSEGLEEALSSSESE
jgi:hypothetical protein